VARVTSATAPAPLASPRRVDASRAIRNDPHPKPTNAEIPTEIHKMITNRFRSALRLSIARRRPR